MQTESENNPSQDKQYYSIDYSKLTPGNILLLDNETLAKLVSLIDAECTMRAKELSEVRQLLASLQIDLSKRLRIEEQQSLTTV